MKIWCVFTNAVEQFCQPRCPAGQHHFLWVTTAGQNSPRLSEQEHVWVGMSREDSAGVTCTQGIHWHFSSQTAKQQATSHNSEGLPMYAMWRITATQHVYTHMVKSEKESCHKSFLLLKSEYIYLLHNISESILVSLYWSLSAVLYLEFLLFFTLIAHLNGKTHFSCSVMRNNCFSFWMCDDVLNYEVIVSDHMNVH